MPEASFLVLGLTNPLPERLIREFAASVERLVVIEELDPILETQIKAMGIACEGKGAISPFGELRPELVAKALRPGFVETKRAAQTQAPSRPPLFCPG